MHVGRHKLQVALLMLNVGWQQRAKELVLILDRIMVHLSCTWVSLVLNLLLWLVVRNEEKAHGWLFIALCFHDLTFDSCFFVPIYFLLISLTLCNYFLILISSPPLSSPVRQEEVLFPESAGKPFPSLPGGREAEICILPPGTEGK